MRCYGLARNKISDAGMFQSDVEQYLSLALSYGYAAKSVPSARVVLCRFFKFVVSEKIKNLEDIRPSTITRFIASERARGIKGGKHIGYISMMFARWIEEGKVDMANPVIPRIHCHREPTPDPRPYENKDMSYIWRVLESAGVLVLLLAAAIGEECGLRIGEVCNIRLSDIDRAKQTIFVRLPTKNKRTRTVPFHDKVNKYLDLWLPQRDARCSHDHLLHGKLRAFYKTASLDEKFADVLSPHPEPAASFEFHRLRHTWATRLMNNGMELAVLKELGGWVSWSSMQRYIKVLPQTIRSQYEEAYAKLQKTSGVQEEELLSFADFVAMADSCPGNDLASSV